MRSSVVSALLLAGCWQRSFSQGVLEHAGEDCYFNCWKTPGYCSWCGAGNACCKAGDNDNDPLECHGALNYSSSVGGRFHECVKPLFMPGETPPAGMHGVGQIHTLSQAQCISYMAQTGCGWTNDYSCPNQPMGHLGAAEPDQSIGYKCCCTNGLWTQDATRVDTSAMGGRNPAEQAQCGNYMSSTGCGWTSDYKCPNQPPPAGSKGTAGNDGSLGYACCCLNGLWQVGVTTTFFDPNAFNVDHGMDVNNELSDGLSTTLIPVNQDTGFAINVAPGSQHGTGVHETSGRDPNFFENHDGINERVDTVHQVFDANFIPTAHHGPIHNSNSRNDPDAKREGCVAGICADLDTNNPDEQFQTGTHHGVTMDTAGEGKELPGYKVKVDHDNDVHVTKIVNGEEVEIATRRRRRRRKSALNPVTAAHTETVMAIAAGTTLMEVDNALGFNVGDTISIGGVETKTIVSESITGRQAAVFNLDSPIVGNFRARTAVDKQPPIAARTQAVATESRGSSTSSPDFSKKGWLLLGASLCCCLCVAAAAGFAVMSNKTSKKTRKKALDREAYIKNDFIERQPVYSDTDVPASQEEPLMAVAAVDVNGDGIADVMVAGVDANRDGIPDVLQAPMLPPLQPTGSFPLQQTVSAAYPVTTYTTAAPMATPSLASFPGMPPIGTGSILQPRTTSMSTALPYGGSTYVTGGSTYIQQPSQQLGVTTNLTSFPQYR